MVKVFEGTTDEYYMDGYLKNIWDECKVIIKRDWDMIFGVDGCEGSGKSVLTMSCAKYCYPAFSINDITFNPKDFRAKIIVAAPYSAVVYDEAFTGLNSRGTMSLINRTLISMLAEIRQKNLFVFVVMPTFFDLDKYVALFRSRGLLHCYTGDNFQRGFFAFYNVDRKKDLYILGKKFYSYKTPRPNFIGRFTNHYPIDEQEYRKKKFEALSDRMKKQDAVEASAELEELLFTRIMEEGEHLTHDQKMKLLGMPRASYYLKLRKYNQQTT